jgi:copper/silver efflux system protein
MKPAMHSIHLHAALDRILLNLSFQRFAKVAMIMLTRPVAMVGAVWMLYINAEYFSVAVSAGLIALARVAIETVVICCST